MERVVPAAEGPSQAQTDASVDTVSTGDYTPMRTRQRSNTPKRCGDPPPASERRAMSLRA